MKVQAQIVAGDYQAFLKWINAQMMRHRNPWLSVVILAIPFGVGLGLYLAYVARRGDDQSFLLMLAGFIGGVVFLYCFALLWVKLQRKQLSPADPGFMLGLQSIELVEDGIRVASQHHESLFRWSLISGPEMTPQHLFIPVDRIAAIIIPLASFASEIECARFADEILSRAKRPTPYWKAFAKKS